MLSYDFQPLGSCRPAAAGLHQVGITVAQDRPEDGKAQPVENAIVTDFTILKHLINVVIIKMPSWLGPAG